MFHTVFKHFKNHEHIDQFACFLQTIKASRHDCFWDHFYMTLGLLRRKRKQFDPNHYRCPWRHSLLLITSGIWRPPLVLSILLFFSLSDLLCPNSNPNFFFGLQAPSLTHSDPQGPHWGLKINLTVLKIINLVAEEGLPVTCYCREKSYLWWALQKNSQTA